MQQKEDVIQKLDLTPHPEGGYYKQTYKSKGSITINSSGTENSVVRPYSTCIYFLLTSDNFSAFHRIKQDEIWHFYDGSPIKLHTISKEGIYKHHIIGRDIMNGEVPQLLVTGGHWFGAEVMNKNSFTLTGCTVAPGFDFEDFELMEEQEGIRQFPMHKEIIRKLTR